MKKSLFMILSVCILLSTIVQVSAATVEPNTSYGTYYGYFEASMPISTHTLSNGFVCSAWTLPIKMNYSAQYNSNTGKITSVTYTGAQFFPGNTVSPEGYSSATSINNDSATIGISSDGYSITFTPHCQISIICCQYPGSGINQEFYQTSSTGPSVTVQPDTY